MKWCNPSFVHELEDTVLLLPTHVIQEFISSEDVTPHGHTLIENLTNSSFQWPLETLIMSTSRTIWHFHTANSNGLPDIESACHWREFYFSSHDHYYIFDQIWVTEIFQMSVSPQETFVFQSMQQGHASQDSGLQ